MFNFVKEKMTEGFSWISLDESGFGGYKFRKYGWAKVG